MAKRFGSTYARRNVRRRLNFGARRVSRRRRFARSRRNKTWTSQSATGNQFNYRTRRMRPRAWRRMLWRDTIGQQHYRSQGQGTGTLTTGTSQGNGNVQIFNPTFIGVPGPTTAFWTATGGLQPTDAGAAVATFGASDLVIRGGRIGITISCPDAVTQEVACTIWVVRVQEDPNYTFVPTVQSYGGMIDSTPDFQKRVGKVLYNKSAILSGAYPHMTLEHRLRVEKIDQEIFGTELGSQIIFIVSIANLQSADDLTLFTSVYHDLSFTGDAVA